MGSVVSTLTELSLLTTILILETLSVVEMYVYNSDRNVYNRITMSIHWTITGGVYCLAAWLQKVEDYFDCKDQWWSVHNNASYIHQRTYQVV